MSHHSPVHSLWWYRSSLLSRLVAQLALQLVLCSLQLQPTPTPTQESNRHTHQG